MSTIMLNISFSNDPAESRTVKQGRKRKYRRRKPVLNFSPLKRPDGQSRRLLSSDRNPVHNGTATKQHASSSSGDTDLPHPDMTSSVSQGGSRPSASTRTLPDSDLSVNTKDSHVGPKEPRNTKPSTATCGPSSSSTHKSTSTCGPSASSTYRSTPMSAGAPSKYLAIDCEMVGTGPRGHISQLGRCSIVSYDGDVVYDKFIKPPVPVTDYRTRWSGIRHRDLYGAMPYSQARKEILKLLMGKVVIGHAIHNDFKVLGYSHPAALTRDTSRIPLLNQMAGYRENECVSLKRLTEAVLNRNIQTGKKGHSSVEDAKATMELYRVVEQEWERRLASK